jgi:hypothetical protein
MPNWDDELKKIIRSNWDIGVIFSLYDIYLREDHFSTLFPQNKHVRPKLRQILQHLRDQELIEFM